MKAKTEKSLSMRFYERLENDYLFIIIVILTMAINVFGIKVVISNEIVGVSITMFSIIYGFLVSSVCNLFGRKITSAMSKSVVGNQTTELRMFRKSLIKFVFKGVIFILISIMIYILRLYTLPEDIKSSIYVTYIELGVSGYYVSQLIYIAFSMYYFFIVLVNMLVNEEYLNGN